MHLDLKPLNILIRENGRLLLSDFGLAHLMKQGIIEGGSSLRAGTPHYMAPEHIKGSPERRSDLFSLGIMLYQMLVGRLPFDGLPHDTILLRNLTEWPPAPRSLRPELPRSVEDMLGKAIAKYPEQRHQTAGNLLTAFKNAVAVPSLFPSLNQQIYPPTILPTSKLHRSQYPATVPRSHNSRQLRLDIGQLTDVGRERPDNKDNMAYVIPKDEQMMTRKGVLFIVADGRHDHPAGETASEIAVDTVTMTYYQDDSEEIALSLMNAIKRANTIIHQRAAENMLRSGMGTTCVSAVLRGHIAYVANVGDSRAYVIRHGQVRQVSQDHSWVEEQVRAGLLTRDQARSHAQRNVITRCLGTQVDVEVDVFTEELEDGDCLILCTDGLSGSVYEDDLRCIVEQYVPQESVYHLVERANENGGPDNITAIVVRVQEVS